MTIAIEIHGTISHGLWSPERGESRWAQNIAAVLGAAGIPVMGFGSWTPGADPWGECPRVPNVEFAPWPVLKDADYRCVFDAAHWDGKPILGRPRSVLRGYFSYQSAIMESDWPANHRLVYPYQHSLLASNFGRNPGRLLQLPVIPLDWWGRYMPSPPAWPATRKGVVWGTKPPQSPESTTGRWWTAMLDVARDLGGPASFAGGAHYPDHWRRQAEAVPGAALYGMIPLGPAQALMRGATVCLNPPYSGLFFLEAVMEGCCPTVWRNDYIPSLESATLRVDASLLLDPATPDRAAFARVAERLLTDDRLRADLLAEYQSALAPYSPEAALACWREVDAWIPA